MKRRIYIVPKTDKEDWAKIEADALANDCPEIINGIPPRLKNEIKEEDLPLVYEEEQIKRNKTDVEKRLEALEEAAGLVEPPESWVQRTWNKITGK